jgi:hypothetical protein
MYMCVTSCICVLRHVYVCYVMYMCVTSCICVLRHVYVCYVMYMCVTGIDVASFYGCSLRLFSNSVVFSVFILI